MAVTLISALIAAILPSYADNGDCTTIIATDGTQQVLPQRINSVLRHLSRRQAIDLVALRQQTALRTRKAILQPLALAPGLLLIPCKVRQPRVKGDPCMGYVNYYAVTDITACSTHPFKTTIKLCGGACVNSLWTPKTVDRYIQYAQLTFLGLLPGPFHRLPNAFSNDPYIELANSLIQALHELLHLRSKQLNFGQTIDHPNKLPE